MQESRANPWRQHDQSTGAKNVFLWQGRSWIRKGLEVYFTFMIELIWGKSGYCKCI
jgi:hypothetical protein